MARRNFLRWARLAATGTAMFVAGSATTYVGVETCLREADKLQSGPYAMLPRGKTLTMAFLGDSLLAPVERRRIEGEPTMPRKMASLAGTLIDARTRRLGASPTLVHSHFAQDLPVRTLLLARNGAFIDGAYPSYFSRFGAKKIGNILDYSDQINRVIDSEVMPNLIVDQVLLNTIDWRFISGGRSAQEADQLYRNTPQLVVDAKRNQLRRVIERARRCPSPTQICLVGAPHPESFLAARAGLLVREQQGDPYASAKFDYVTRFHYPSILNATDQKLWCILARRTNTALHYLATELNDNEARRGSPVSISYANVLSAARFEPSHISSADFLHPSREGHSYIADRLVQELTPAVRQLKLIE